MTVTKVLKAQIIDFGKVLFQRLQVIFKKTLDLLNHKNLVNNIFLQLATYIPTASLASLEVFIYNCVSPPHIMYASDFFNRPLIVKSLR